VKKITTEYLDIDKDKCTACGDCVNECPNQVLKVVGFKFIIQHKHVKVQRPENCTGCLSCVEACSEGVIIGLQTAASR
jgi:NAD-dependent dihydropyrimidine dehydrogenase PreA subunit